MGYTSLTHKTIGINVLRNYWLNGVFVRRQLITSLSTYLVASRFLVWSLMPTGGERRRDRKSKVSPWAIPQWAWFRLVTRSETCNKATGPYSALCFFSQKRKEKTAKTRQRSAKMVKYKTLQQSRECWKRFLDQIRSCPSSEAQKPHRTIPYGFYTFSSSLSILMIIRDIAEFWNIFVSLWMG